MADIQVNLVDKKERKDQSHDFAKKIRPAVHETAKKYGAKYVAVVEVPPGPPVLSPIVAEVYGPDLKSQEAFALQVLDVFKKSPSITDEGIYLESPHKMLVLKAKDDVLKLVGMSKEEFVHTLTALLRWLSSRTASKHRHRAYTHNSSTERKLQELGAFEDPQSSHQRWQACSCVGACGDFGTGRTQKYIPQEPKAGGLCDRRCGRKGGGSLLWHS
jgi:multidrug efflux pump subunit AcrB